MKKASSQFLETIPISVLDKQLMEEPAFMRKKTDVQMHHSFATIPAERQKIHKVDQEKPAFLRKIMD